MAPSAVFPESGGLRLAQRTPSRRAYRIVDLQRWRGRRGLRFGLHPRVWPFDAGLADRALLALARAGADPERFVAAGFAARRDGGRGRVGGPGRFRESASALPGEACADSQS